MHIQTRLTLALAAFLASFGASAIEFAEPCNVPPLFEPGVTPRSEAGWRNTRRPELKKMLETEVYGLRPVERPPHLVFSAAEPDAVMMDGAATRKRIRIEYGGKYGTNSFVCTAFIPRAEKPAPAFVFICNRPPDENIDPTRKVKSGFWPAEEIVARGYATVAFHTSDVAPDKQHGNTRGAFAAFEDVERQYRSQTAWGALSVWAWAASRVLDWIETEPTIDASHVAVIGHSRGGKTALVAAAWDERFAMAVSSCSGTGGAKLNHVDLPDSEHIVQSVASHQFWYCRRYTRWVNLDAQAPFDQHMLVALIAPRLVCIGSATEDYHAGPFGEYCTARYASPAWTIFGKKGFVSHGFPEPESPQQEGDISYHIRTGKHDLTPYDWNVYMDFADKHGWRKSAPLVRLPHRGKSLEGRFHPTYASVHDAATSRARAVPSFLRGSVMYQLFTRMFTPEGTFAAARAKLPELKADGVDIVYLTPHQLADDDPDPRFWSGRQKACRLNNPKNPYRQKDFFAVDPEYGTKEDLKAFVAEAHRLGMKVMFDLVYFHCGPKAVFLAEHPDFIVRNPDGTPKLGDWAFPELDIAKPAVREYLYSNMESFIRDYDVDGFRCDVADMLPVEFWEEGYRRCKALKPDVFMMCEGLKGDDQIAAFDLSYGFYTQWTIVSMLEGKSPASLLEKAWRAQVRDYPRGFHWMRCFENHDFANVNPGQKRKEELYGHPLNAAMIATCFLLDGIPMLYNGQEIADARPHSIYANRDHGKWCIDWSRANDEAAVARRALVRRLTSLRHAHPDLFDAPVVWHSVPEPEKAFAFSRPLPDGTTLTLAVNISRDTVSLALPGGRTVTLPPHAFDLHQDP